MRTALRALSTLLVAFVACFLLLHAMPGDPADSLAAPGVPAEQALRTRVALGLDRPLAVQLWRTVSSYARGDLGDSTSRRRPVRSALLEALPYSAALGAATLLLAYGFGLPLALGAVALRARWRARVEALLLGLATVPRFWLGAVLILAFHDALDWFPASHAFAPGGRGVGDGLLHLVLPALALGVPAACVVARFQLSAMEALLDEPHVRAARATGCGTLALLVRHVFRPSLSVTATLLALDLPVIISGAIAVEVVFAWPGLGRLTAGAILGGDYPLALGAATCAAVVVVLGRLLADGVARRIDPRPASPGAEP